MCFYLCESSNPFGDDKISFVIKGFICLKLEKERFKLTVPLHSKVDRLEVCFHLAGTNPSLCVDFHLGKRMQLISLIISTPVHFDI